MSLEEQGIAIRQYGGGWAAVIRSNVKNRGEIKQRVEQLGKAVPADLIAGPPFWIRHFIHSYPEGFDAEVGFPVNTPLELGEITSRKLPEWQVLSKIHSGSADHLGQTYQDLFQCQDQYGVISDEFCLEVMLDGDPLEGRIEVLLVRHPWEALFEEAVARELGEGVRQHVVGDADTLFIESPLADRFAWTKGVIDRLDEIADDRQRYEVISSCSHVFPREQAEKMRAVYLEAVENGAGLLEGVDAVVDFMVDDPGWRPNINRDGYTLLATKNPRDREAYQRAKTDLERKQAYCFCPIVRQNLADGMSPSFCYCSAGFERKQWEIVLGQPLRIEVIKSLLKGHDECQFAIQLPES